MGCGVSSPRSSDEVDGQVLFSVGSGPTFPFPATAAGLAPTYDGCVTGDPTQGGRAAFATPTCTRRSAETRKEPANIYGALRQLCAKHSQGDSGDSDAAGGTTPKTGAAAFHCIPDSNGAVTSEHCSELSQHRSRLLSVDSERRGGGGGGAGSFSPSLSPSSAEERDVGSPPSSPSKGTLPLPPLPQLPPTPPAQPPQRYGSGGTARSVIIRAPSSKSVVSVSWVGDEESEGLSAGGGKGAQQGGGQLLQHQPSFAGKAEDLIHVAELFQHEVLDLDSCAMKEVPDCIEEVCSCVTTLYLSNNQLSSTPDVFATLSHLRVLSLSGNIFRELPEAVCFIQTCTELDISHNFLSSIPEAICNMTSLAQLNLDYNEFVDFPVEVLCVKNISRIFLAENHLLRSLPGMEVMKRCSALEQIICDNNPTVIDLVRAPTAPLHAKKALFTWNQVFPDRVRDGLFIGSLRSAQNDFVYKELGIKHVVTCGRNLRVNTHGVDHLEVAVEDVEEQPLLPFLETAIKYITEREGKGGVLVHCFAGLSRSATVVLAYLMARHRVRLDTAIEELISVRPAVHPNPGFVNDLVSFDRQLFGEDARPLDMTNLGKERTERLLATHRRDVLRSAGNGLSSTSFISAAQSLQTDKYDHATIETSDSTRDSPNSSSVSVSRYRTPVKVPSGIAVALPS